MTQTRTIVFWIIGALAFFGFLYLIRSMLLPFVIGMGVAYFLDPAADKLEKWGTSRLMATAFITVNFFLLIALALSFLLPALYHQFQEFVLALPNYIATAKAAYGPKISQLLSRFSHGSELSFDTMSDEAKTQLVTLLTGFMASVAKSSINIISILSLILITPVVAFYMLRDWDRLVAHIDGLLPLPYAETIREQVRQIDRTLSGFVRGQLTVCLLLGIFYASGLSILGLNFSLLIGLTTGLLAIIPYVGLLSGMLVGVIVAFIQFGDWSQVAMVLGVFALGQFIEGNFVTPKLVGDKVGLHPLWIIFGMLAGGTLFGFVGILIAVPVTAVIGVLVRFGTSRYRDSTLFHGAPVKNFS